jgi:hypothetical protein
MWIRTASHCGGFFHCNAGHAAVRCGSRYYRPPPGQDRANCSCSSKRSEEQAVPPTVAAKRKTQCGAHISTDGMGGVSPAYRRLPQPVGEDQSVKCCRNKQTFGGPIDWNVTLTFTKVGVAPWPSVCEPLCSNHPSGRCRFFSHSVIWKNCILCSSCEPEIMIGDGSQARAATVSHCAVQSRPQSKQCRRLEAHLMCPPEQPSHATPTAIARGGRPHSRWPAKIPPSSTRDATPQQAVPPLSLASRPCAARALSSSCGRVCLLTPECTKLTQRALQGLRYGSPH